MQQKINFGLIGKTLNYSFSKKYFEEKYAKNDFKKYGLPQPITEKLNYKLYELKKIEEVLTLINDPSFVGFNVTIPYKQEIIPFLSKLDAAAKELGAVNVVVLERSKNQKVEVVGYNTDYLGFTHSLLEWLPKNIAHNQLKAIILGTGGASKAIVYALKQLNISYKIVSRTAKPTHNIISYQELSSAKKTFDEHHLIINTTPLGTFPDVDASPQIPYQWATAQHFFYDLVYNPKVSSFLQRGQEQGAKIINGYNMLVGQAEASWDIWLQEKNLISFIK